MRFQSYLKENDLSYFSNLLMVGETIELNEMSKDTFNKLKKVGSKLGLRIVKSNTLVDLLKKAGKGVDDIFRYAVLYLYTDVSDSESRRELVKDARKVVKHVNIQNLMSFLMQMDKLTIGLTAQIRHIIQSIFGIEITSYNNWEDDLKYLSDAMGRMRKVLNGMGDSNDEIKIINQLEISITSKYGA